MFSTAAALYVHKSQVCMKNNVAVFKRFIKKGKN